MDNRFSDRIIFGLPKTFISKNGHLLPVTARTLFLFNFLVMIGLLLSCINFSAILLVYTVILFNSWAVAIVSKWK